MKRKTLSNVIMPLSCFLLFRQFWQVNWRRNFVKVILASTDPLFYEGYETSLMYKLTSYNLSFYFILLVSIFYINYIFSKVFLHTSCTFFSSCTRIHKTFLYNFRDIFHQKLLPCAIFGFNTIIDNSHALNHYNLNKKNKKDKA